MNLRRIYRSSRTGLFVSKTDTTTSPDTTTTETMQQPFTDEHLNALGALAACANKHGLREAIRRLQA